MAEARTGDGFIRHEFDEAIAVQQAILDAERALEGDHPLPDAKKAIGQMRKTDEQQLDQLRSLGERFGATGKAEEVAGALQRLTKETTQSVKGAPESETYEAHAVLLTLKRKQQDAATAVAKIGQEMGDREIRTAATEMQKEARTSADELSNLLAQLAVQIATGDGAAASR